MSRLRSTRNKVITIVTLLVSLLVAAHEPLKSQSPRGFVSRTSLISAEDCLC